MIDRHGGEQQEALAEDTTTSTTETPGSDHELSGDELSEDQLVDEESEESFPASDAPSFWAGPEAEPEHG